MVNNLLDIASQGRFGDTELVHVQPWEKQLLTDLGGSNTVNPNTGLREYWSNLFGLSVGQGEDEGSAAGGIFSAWRPSEGAWGILGESGGTTKKRRAEQKAQRTEKAFKAGIGDFRDVDFANMSEEERASELRKLFGKDFDAGDTDLYFDQEYDEEQELDVRETGAQEIGAIGGRAQSGLLELATGEAQMKSRSGFAQSGNPMIDKQRRDIFADITTETGETYKGLLDTVGDLEDAYNDSFISSAFDMKSAYTSTT